MDLNSVKPLETKEVDVSRFLNLKPEQGDPEKAVFLIKHYSTWQQNEMMKLFPGAKVDGDKVELDTLPDMNIIMVRQLLSGVHKSPFKEPFDEAFIRDIDSRNPELLKFLLKEVTDFNENLKKATTEK